MSINQSNLSNTGFDYVIAVTQDSINAALKEYLWYNKPQEVILCYTYDDNNNLVLTDYNTLVAAANNTDPFSIPDATAGSDPRVQNLNKANFAFAIKAKLGLPPGVAPANLPPIVALNPGQSSVKYTLMFSEFVGTEIVYGAQGKMTWVNQSQPSGTSWNFFGLVDLNFQDTDFTNLPQAAQNQLKDIGDPNMFSVQQLYYDLNNSALDSQFQFNNVPSNSALNDFMTGDFLNTYWKALGGNEVLGYGVKQVAQSPSPLAVTNLNFFTPDAVGTEGAPVTLNYLCAVNNNALPDTTHAGFGWNWIEPNETSYDGVAALNRNVYAQYLNSVLAGYVAGNCYLPWADVYMKDAEPHYKQSMTPGQTPTVSYPTTGSTILSYSYKSATSESHSPDDAIPLGKMELSSTFDLSVSVQGNQMTIVQHLVVYCYLMKQQSHDSGNVIDKQITDTYEFAVDENGQIVVSTPSATATPPTSVTVDNSKTPGVNGFLNFFTEFNDLSNDVATWAKSIVATSLTDVPVSSIQNFVFPGGATFTFADVSFSDNQDLVSHITYAGQ